MTNLIKRIYEADGTFQDVEMTSKEASDFTFWQQAKIAEAEAKHSDQLAKAAAKEAVLAKLGLTADEAAALLA